MPLLLNGTGGTISGVLMPQIRKFNIQVFLVNE